MLRYWLKQNSYWVVIVVCSFLCGMVAIRSTTADDGLGDGRILSWLHKPHAFLFPHNHACCDRCGETKQCCKICRLVKEEKKVPVVCWGYESEDFCLPGPSLPGCEHCETVCKPGEDDKKVCSKCQPFVWQEWIPSNSSKIFTKKKLMKKTETKTVPSYKWVVEDLCAECQSKTPSNSTSPDDKLPPKHKDSSDESKPKVEVKPDGKGLEREPASTKPPII